MTKNEVAMRAIVAFALVLGLIVGSSGAADARFGTLAGSWFADVSPQAAPPEFPEPPPELVSTFNFGLVGTVTETDGVQIALVTTTFDLELRRDGTLEGEGSSDFIMGSNPNGEAFFNGPVRLEASRIRVPD